MPDRCDAGLALRTYAGRGGADHGQLHGTGDVNGKERKRAPERKQNCLSGTL